MKNLAPRLRCSYLALSLWVSALGAAAAWAAQDPFEKPLTDAEIQRMLPLLKAERADMLDSKKELEVLLKASEKQNAQLRALVASIGEGKVDPLAWLQEHSRSVQAPPQSSYHAACSRSWSRHLQRPAAVFSLGAAPGAAAESLKAAQAFYKAKGFRSHGKIEPYNWGFEASDESLAASVMELNHFFRHEECAAMGPGPTVVLAPPADKLDPTQTGVPASISEGKRLDQALKRAGVSSETYQLFRLRVFMAREGARHPPSLHLSPSAAGEGATAERVRKQMEAAMAGRRSSAAAYQRHARVLDPLLDEGDTVQP